MKPGSSAYIAPPFPLPHQPGITPMSLPAGLTWRSEFAPQHADGKEKPSARASKPATTKGEAAGTAGTETQPGGAAAPPPVP